MKLEVDNPLSLVVTPLSDEEGAFDVDSLDLRLGSRFLLPRLFQQSDSSADDRLRSFHEVPVHVPFKEVLVVPAHQTVLGATLEFIKLPADVSGQILTKSSVARRFLVIETAPWIHPGYRGCLTLEIANVSNTPIPICSGAAMAQLVLMHVSDSGKGRVAKRLARMMAQLVLMHLSEPADSQLLDADYLGPVYPEARTAADSAK
jgi:dCTP deaminase